MSSFIDLIDLIRIQADIYHNARVCGDWIIQEHSQGDTCFHMATQGDCYLEVPGQGKWLLAEGDLVIFPREIPHRMWPKQTLSGSQQHLPIAQSQQLAGTSMLCGKIYFQHCSSEHLLDALPPVFVIPRNDSTPWLSGLLTLIVEESLRIDETTNVILNRLCELLFSLALRYFIENGHCQTGVLSLFAHRQINKAIKVLHNAPSENWQLQTLAECAAMSRTQFSQTFKKLSGWTPMQYVTWWRMQLAWSHLQSGNTVAITAEKVGYQSEAAFSRAFRKQFNQSAGAVRRGDQ